MDLDRARGILIENYYEYMTSEEQIALDILIKYAFRFENIQRTFKAMLENVDTLSLLCEVDLKNMMEGFENG